MPYVLEYNAIADLKKHAKVASLLGENIEALTLREAAFKAPQAFKNLLIDLNFPTSVKEVGVTDDMIPKLAENVFKSASHVNRNPRRITKEDMVALSSRAIEGRLASEK
jgi:alcohol dehydrogenase